MIPEGKRKPLVKKHVRFDEGHAWARHGMRLTESKNAAKSITIPTHPISNVDVDSKSPRPRRNCGPPGSFAPIFAHAAVHISDNHVSTDTKENFRFVRHDLLDFALASFHAYVAEKSAARDPQNYPEAMASLRRVKWIVAQSEEVHNLRANRVYCIVDRPKGVKILTARWV